MTEHPNTTRGDVAYWQLTHTQAARYHARIARMYADQATRFADLAVHYANRGVIGTRIAAALAGIALVLAVIGAVTG